MKRRALTPRLPTADFPPNYTLADVYSSCALQVAFGEPPLVIRLRDNDGREVCEALLWKHCRLLLETRRAKFVWIRPDGTEHAVEL